jgi:hypothetical protein
MPVVRVENFEIAADVRWQQSDMHSTGICILTGQDIAWPTAFKLPAFNF